MKIAFVAGTRPEIIKLGPVHKALRTDPRFSGTELSLILTGQHGDLANRTAEEIDIRPDIHLAFQPRGQALHDAYTDMQCLLTAHFTRNPAELVIVQGDTLSALVGASCAAYQRIPVAHVEAGLRSGHPTNPFPEELNRHIISTLSLLHFAPTALAAQALQKENIPDNSIVVTGNTVIDALENMKAKGHSAFTKKLNDRKRVIVTCHRRENWERGLKALLQAILLLLQKRPDANVVFPMHSNPFLIKQIKHNMPLHDRLQILPPLSYPDFIQTLAHSNLVITDSGGVQEESAYFHIPTLVMRDNTERTEGLRMGHMELCPADEELLANSAVRMLDHNKTLHMVPNPFGDGFASTRIATALHNWRNGKVTLLAPHLQFQRSHETEVSH